MGIKEDFQKLATSWRKLSTIWKTVLGALLVIQFLSLASIANSVYEFKGFIAAGINFYQAVTEPLLILFRFLKLNFFSRELLDSFTLIILTFGVLSKASRAVDASKISKSEMYSILIIIIAIITLYEFLDASPISSIGMLGSMLVITIGIARISRSFIPLILFLFPFITISLLAAVTEGIARA